MNEDFEYLVEQIQTLIEAPGTPYLKALHIVKDILVPAVQKVKEEFIMLDLTPTDNPPN